MGHRVELEQTDIARFLPVYLSWHVIELYTVIAPLLGQIYHHSFRQLCNMLSCSFTSGFF